MEERQNLLNKINLLDDSDSSSDSDEEEKKYGHNRFGRKRPSHSAEYYNQMQAEMQAEIRISFDTPFP